MIEGIKKSLKKYLGLILVILIAIILYRAITSINIKNVLDWLFVLMKPFIYGLIIAYILNPIIRFFKDNVFGNMKIFEGHDGVIMGLSMLLTYSIIIALVCFMVVSIIPQIVSSAQGIVNYLFTYAPKLRSGIGEAISQMGRQNSNASSLYSELNNSFTSVFDTLVNNLSYIPNLMSTLLTGTFNVASWLLNLIIGVIISIYMILNKDNLIGMVKKISYLVFSPEYYKIFSDFMNDTNRTFESFFVGKVIDSTIIALIFFFGCCFISHDYALLFACVIGITNMIPYFGPFIGGIPVIAICLLQAPYSAIWMAIFIFALQQFDGYILGPRVLGNSIGIKPLGVIFAILVGGGLFGVLGMFFGVPVFAVISRAVNNFIDSRVNKKFSSDNIEKEAVKDELSEMEEQEETEV